MTLLYFWPYYIFDLIENVLYEDDEEFLELLRQHTALLLEEEELIAIGQLWNLYIKRAYSYPKGKDT